MATTFVNLPSSAGNGAGTAVDTSTLAATKTIVNGGNGSATEPLVSIEISNDAGGANFTPIYTFQGPGEVTLNVVARWMRTRVANYKGGGAPNVDAGADLEAAAFATLVAPAGSGSGAAVATDLLPQFKTVQVVGPFRGTVNIRVSEDGTSYEPWMSFSAPGVQSLPVTAAFMRVDRVGVPAVDPGLPTIQIAADSGPGGGGGGGGGASVGSTCFIYAEGSGEDGPVVFEDWNDLYAALQAARASGNNNGCYTIMFDPSFASPVTIPSGTYDMTNVTWEGGGTDGSAQVTLDDGVVLTNLRRIENHLVVSSESTAAVITDLDDGDTFYVGIGCTLQAVTSSLIDVTDLSEEGVVTIFLDDNATLSGDAGVAAVLNNSALGTVVIEMAGAKSTITDDAVDSDGGTTTEFDIASSAIDGYSETQAGLAGTFTKTNSTKVRLNPFPQPPAAAITADTVLTEANLLVLADPTVVEDPAILTITLPLAFNRRGQMVVVKNVTSSTNEIVVDTSGADTIDGGANMSIQTGFGAITFVSDGVSDWRPVVDFASHAGASPIPEQWAQNDVPANTANQAMFAQFSTNFDTYRAIRGGSITGISWRFTETVTAGTISVRIRINGVAGTLTGVSTDVSNQNGGQATQPAGVDVFVAGDLIDVQFTTNAGFLPITTDLEVVLDAAFDPPS